MSPPTQDQTDRSTGPLASLPRGYAAAVFGAHGGIGGALVRALHSDPRCAIVHAGARRPPDAVDARIRPFVFDLEDEPSIATASNKLADSPLDLVIVATGLLHAKRVAPEKSWRALDAETLQRSFAINAVGPAMIAKHLLPRLGRKQKSVFAALSARVGSISDNRLGGWHSYRASKAALNMLIRNLAIELARSNPVACCVALHPGTVDTPLSKPFQQGLKAGSVVDPDHAARNLLAVIDLTTPAQSGRLLAWNGEEICF